MRAATALWLALVAGCAGDPEPAASPEPEPSVGATAPVAEEPAEEAAPLLAHAVYLEVADAEAADALLARYDAAGDPAHGYPPSGSAGDPAYPHTITPGGLEGIDTHAVLVAMPGDEAVAAALVAHLTARGYEARSAVVPATPEPLRVLRVRATTEGEPSIHGVGGLRGSFAREPSDAGWLGTRSRATEDGAILFVFEAPAGDRTLLKLEGGGSAEFPYECPVWTLELPEGAPIMELDAPLDTSECMEHG